jgi:BR serine/threonine kinase
MRLFDHPCILPLRDVYESDHHIFIIEGYAPNGSISDYLDCIPKIVAVSFFRQIIYGLEYLHRHRICHRDLKPENLLLTAANQILIADFGFACWMPNNVAMTSCGSPLYSAPEIIRGVPYDGRISDIWSAGVILYVMLTVCFVAGFASAIWHFNSQGKLPFNGESIRAIAQRIKRGSYVMPAGLDPSVVDLIQHILIVDPAKRMTITQIKAHSAFRIGLPESYVVPTPLPLPRMHDRVELSDADTATLGVLQQIAFPDLHELRAQLTSDGSNMAKVFFAMLTQSTDDWLMQQERVDKSPSLGDLDQFFAEHEQRQLARSLIRSGSSGSFTGSLCESFRTAARFSVHADAAPITGEETIDELETQASDLMAILQEFASVSGLAFLHPDYRLLIVRNPGTGALFRLRAAYTDETKMSLTIKQIRGEDSDEFPHFVAEVLALLKDLIVVQKREDAGDE